MTSARTKLAARLTHRHAILPPDRPRRPNRRVGRLESSLIGAGAIPFQRVLGEGRVSGNGLWPVRNSRPASRGLLRRATSNGVLTLRLNFCGPCLLSLKSPRFSASRPQLENLVSRRVRGIEHEVAAPTRVIGLPISGNSIAPPSSCKSQIRSLAL